MVGISKISVEWTDEWRILPKFSQLINTWNHYLGLQNPIGGGFLFESLIPPVSERAGGWWQWPEPLPRNCPRQPHLWGRPLPRTSLHPRTSRWGRINSQPLFPQLRATQEGHPGSRAPHWELRICAMGFLFNFSLCPVLCPSLSRIDTKGISLQFSVPKLHLRVCLPGNQSETNWPWGEVESHWWWAIQRRPRSSCQRATLDYF